MSSENWKEIKTAGEFSEMKDRGAGYVVVTGGADESTIHAPSCGHLTEARFAEKVLENNSRHGKYFWTDDLDFAMYKWDAYKCGNCLR